MLILENAIPNSWRIPDLVKKPQLFSKGWGILLFQNGLYKPFLRQYNLLGLLTNYVNNGFTTLEALDMTGTCLDSFRVDIRGFSKRTYEKMRHISDFEAILEVTKRARKKWGKFHRSLIPPTLGQGTPLGKINVDLILGWKLKDIAREASPIIPLLFEK